ncbi:MAG: hypothetical protein WBE76_09695 [Terracidiphilus sp.]
MTVRLNVVLGRMLGVLGGVQMMAMRRVRVVGGLFVVASDMMLRGFLVVARSVLVVLRCLLVVIGCFLRHGESPFACSDFVLPARIIGRGREGWCYRRANWR